MAKSKKAFAPVSYNSPLFLKRKLEELVKAGILDFYVYIYHQADIDSKKEHFHLYMQPKIPIDRTALLEEFKEPDLAHPELPPLGCVWNYRETKIDDWLWYCKHDKEYLASKLAERNCYYNWSDFDCNSDALLEELIRSAEFDSDYAMQKRRREALYSNSYSMSELIRSGAVPLGLASQLNSILSIHEKEKYYDREY